MGGAANAGGWFREPDAPDAAAIIDGLRTPGVGGDISSILNKIVVEWAVFRNKMALSSV